MGSILPSVERRHRRLVVTRNTEYFLRDDLVVAVRLRSQARFASEHPALGMQVIGLVDAQKGARLWFADRNGRLLVTSEVVELERPPLELVKACPSL